MKKDWTYKKLGEVAEIYQPKTLATSELISDGKYLVYGANGVIGRYNEYNHKEKEILVTCRGATCGTINISKPYSWINGNAMVVHIIDDTLSFDFLKYCLKHLDWSNIITGAAQPQITRQNLSPTLIPIPPLSIQRSIVSELDLLHSLIEKKQEQLRALENLALSLFYQMFGDPITNPMGWEIKKLGEVCMNITDGDHMPPPKSNDGVPFITISNINKESNQIDFTNTFFVPQIYYDAIKDERKARIGDVLYTVTGSYGIPIIVDDDKPFCFQRHIGLLRPNQDIIIPVYLANWIKSEGGKQQADAKATGIAQKTVSLSSLKTFSLPLPPLSLQQSFAAKVSAIEAQKQAITQSIHHTEALLAQRMDQYFSSLPVSDLPPVVHDGSK